MIRLCAVLVENTEERGLENISATYTSTHSHSIKRNSIRSGITRETYSLIMPFMQISGLRPNILIRFHSYIVLCLLHNILTRICLPVYIIDKPISYSIHPMAILCSFSLLLLFATIYSLCIYACTPFLFQSCQQFIPFFGVPSFALFKM